MPQLETSCGRRICTLGERLLKKILAECIGVAILRSVPGYRYPTKPVFADVNEGVQGVRGVQGRANRRASWLRILTLAPLLELLELLVLLVLLFNLPPCPRKKISS